MRSEDSCYKLGLGSGRVVLSRLRASRRNIRASLRRLLLLVMLTMTIPLEGCFFYLVYDRPSHATRAEELYKDHHYAEAIKEYRLHMEERLAKADRASDENPYFYELLIGDCYLELNEPKEAEAAYGRARAHQVSPGLTNERFRHLGQWYEQRGDYTTAMAVLKRYRELDPEMFNLDIDRVYKEQVKKEDGRGDTFRAAPTP